MKKRIVALVLTLALAMGLMSGLVFAADDETGGICGDSAYWEFDASTGTLTISGTGEMDDYDGSWDLPWYDLKDEILSIVIEEGVTSVGSWAFCFCGNLESVSLPTTLTSIGSEAFISYKGLVNIEIPASVTSIGYAAFGIVIDEFTTDDDLAEEEIEFEVITRSVIFEGDASELIPEYDWPDGAEIYHIFGSVFYAYGGEGIPSYDDYSGQYPDVTIYYYSDAEGFTDEYKALLEECANVTWIVLDRENDETESAGSADTVSSSGDSADSDSDSSDDSWSSLSIINSETTASYTLGSGSGAVIAVDADIDTFVSVTVDGIVLTQDTDYTVTEGSTIITFMESFLETLSEGDHDVVIAFEGGDVETILSIAAAAESSSGSDNSDESEDSDNSSAAEVGDSSGLALWMALGLLAALGLAEAGLRRKFN